MGVISGNAWMVFQHDVNILYCFPGIGAETAEKIYRNDSDIQVIRHFPDYIDRWGKVDSAAWDRYSHEALAIIDRMARDTKSTQLYKFLLLDYRALGNVSERLDGVLCLPSEAAMEHFQNACLTRCNDSKEALAKAQYMATSLPMVAKRLRERLDSGELAVDAIYLGDCHHAMFVETLIAAACGYPTAQARVEEFDEKMSVYIDSLKETIIEESMVLTLDEQGHILMRSSDPIPCLDNNKLDEALEAAEALGISVRELEQSAFRGVGADFITLSKDDARAIADLLDEVVAERGGDDVKAFGDKGISYERLHDRLSGMMFPVWKARTFFTGKEVTE